MTSRVDFYSLGLMS